MSTPTRTPQRIYIPNIDTSAARRVKDDYNSYCGWETPLTGPDRRRPSLTYSALSEPSPTSLPTTPGYCSSSSHSSFSSVYFPNGMTTTPVRAMNYVKADTDLTRSMQNHGLCYDMINAEDRFQPSHMTAEDQKYQAGMVMSPLHDAMGNSFSSNASNTSWEPVSQVSMPICTQPIVFRPSSVPNMDSFGNIDALSKSMCSESGVTQLQSAISTCPSTTSFDSLHGSSFLNPHQLIIPPEIHDSDNYGYVQPVDSSMTSPVEQGNMHTGSFESTFSSLSPWSQIEAASPINEYTLPGDDLVGSNAMGLKDVSPMQSLLAQHDYDQHSPTTPRRYRARGKLASSKRCRTMTHQLAHHSFGVDVSIDSKSLKVDGNGRITKKNDGIETKRWKCTHEGCDSRSARKEHLRRHELSHMPEKQFHCNLPKCNRAITRSDNLIQHLMTHVRPPKAGKRNNHHSPKRVEQMVLETMKKDPKLAERTITNLRKAIEREQEKWPRGMDAEDMEWDPSDIKNGSGSSIDEDTVENLKYES